MTAARLKFEIPDIELGCGAGPRVNPSSFAGHELIVLFCPMDVASAAEEIRAYRNSSDEFVRRDAWLLAIADRKHELEDGPQRLLVIPDPDRHAWTAFRNLTGHAEEFDGGKGAVFLFTRGGNLHRYWHGRGHVADVLEELARPPFEHAHQLGE